MLTNEAMEERKWGRFPSLRKALANKTPPPAYYGPTSASETISDEMGRLLEISAIAMEYRDYLKKNAENDGEKHAVEDLLRLAERLDGISKYVRQAADEVRALSDSL